MNLTKANIEWETLGFDAVETRSMFMAKCSIDGKWSGGSLIPYGNIELSPAAGALNYGQGESSIFPYGISDPPDHFPSIEHFAINMLRVSTASKPSVSHSIFALVKFILIILYQ
jgi:hypothetical protein